MMNGAGKLGRLYADALCFHDARKFTSLEKTASNMFLILKFQPATAAKAGRLVSKAYGEADRAERSGASYGKVLLELTKIETLLGLPSGVAYCQTRWWEEFRKKNWLLVLYYLFRQHLKAFGILNVHKALPCTYHLAMAGKAHHDRVRAAAHAAKYFEVILLLERDRVPFIG